MQSEKQSVLLQYLKKESVLITFTDENLGLGYSLVVSDTC